MHPFLHKAKVLPKWLRTALVEEACVELHSACLHIALHCIVHDMCLHPKEFSDTLHVQIAGCALRSWHNLLLPCQTCNKVQQCSLTKGVATAGRLLFVFIGCRSSCAFRDTHCTASLNGCTCNVSCVVPGFGITLRGAAGPSQSASDDISVFRVYTLCTVFGSYIGS